MTRLLNASRAPSLFSWSAKCRRNNRTRRLAADARRHAPADAPPMPRPARPRLQCRRWPPETERRCRSPTRRAGHAADAKRHLARTVVPASPRRTPRSAAARSCARARPPLAAVKGRIEAHRRQVPPRLRGAEHPRGTSGRRELCGRPEAHSNGGPWVPLLEEVGHSMPSKVERERLQPLRPPA